jgi:hypothetical protein
MADPPSPAGARHESCTCPFPATAETPIGADGTVAGVTATDAADGGPVPALLIASTVKVYAVPSTSPVMTWLVAGDGKVRGLRAVPPTEGVTS